MPPNGFFPTQASTRLAWANRRVHNAGMGGGDARAYEGLALAVLALHLLWIVWVIVGSFFTRRRPWLTAFHVASLVWGIVVETGPWPCPLTLLEQFLEARAGTAAYSGGFMVHYLDRIVYPDVSVGLLTVCGVAVCACNLGVYAYRGQAALRRRRKMGERMDGKTMTDY